MKGGDGKMKFLKLLKEKLSKSKDFKILFLIASLEIELILSVLLSITFMIYK